jgi:dynein heavy chain
VDANSRKKFDEYLRSALAESNSWLLPFPAKSDVYEYVFDKNTQTWIPWMSTVPAFSLFESELQYHEILVPVIESVRSSYLLELLVNHGKHVLVSGPTATGKSVNIRNVLQNKIDRVNYTSVALNFSNKTKVNPTQDALDFRVTIVTNTNSCCIVGKTRSRHIRASYGQADDYVY